MQKGHTLASEMSKAGFAQFLGVVIHRRHRDFVVIEMLQSDTLLAVIDEKKSNKNNG